MRRNSLSYSISGSHSTRCHFAGVTEPGKSATTQAHTAPPILLLFLIILVRLDRWPAQNGRQVDGDSGKYASLGQHAEMGDAQRPIWMFSI
jgi:hypothetical protein